VLQVKDKFPDVTDDQWEDQESALVYLQKVRDKMRIRTDRQSVDRTEGIYPLECIPSEFFGPLMQETIEAIRKGEYTPDIMDRLMFDYGLSDELAAYFNNEALTLVKMKTLTEEEFVAVGQEYNRQMLEVLKDSKQRARTPKPSSPPPPTPLKIEE
jgi:hypothetical protein